MENKNKLIIGLDPETKNEVDQVIMNMDQTIIGSKNCKLASKCYKCDIKKFCNRLLGLYKEGKDLMSDKEFDVEITDTNDDDDELGVCD